MLILTMGVILTTLYICFTGYLFRGCELVWWTYKM